MICKQEVAGNSCVWVEGATYAGVLLSPAPFLSWCLTPFLKQEEPEAAFTRRDRRAALDREVQSNSPAGALFRPYCLSILQQVQLGWEWFNFRCGSDYGVDILQAYEPLR